MNAAFRASVNLNFHWGDEGLRYDFNGKETDNETGIQDYGFRMYNPALGRFFCEDPLSTSYPNLTPYQFASNTPIQAIDLDGLEAFFVHGMLGGPDQWQIENYAAVANTLLDYTNNRTYSGSSVDRSFSWNVDPATGKKLNGINQTVNDRDVASTMLVNHILQYRQENGIVNEEITLIGFSSGGLVALQAARKLYALGYKVNIILFNTPASNTPGDIENPIGNPGISDLISVETDGDELRQNMPGGDYDQDFDIQNWNAYWQIAHIESPVSGKYAKHFVKNGSAESVRSAGLVKLTPVTEGKAQNCGQAAPEPTSAPANSPNVVNIESSGNWGTY